MDVTRGLLLVGRAAMLTWTGDDGHLEQVLVQVSGVDCASGAVTTVHLTPTARD